MYVAICDNCDRDRPAGNRKLVQRYCGSCEKKRLDKKRGSRAE